MTESQGTREGGREGGRGWEVRCGQTVRRDEGDRVTGNEERKIRIFLCLIIHYHHYIIKKKVGREGGREGGR